MSRSIENASIIKVIKIPILDNKKIKVLENWSASFPPYGEKKGAINDGIAEIIPTIKVEFVSFKTYQLIKYVLTFQHKKAILFAPTKRKKLAFNIRKIYLLFP